jgi:hypothetical protein
MRPCILHSQPSKKSSFAVGNESLTAEKMDACRWVKPKLVCQVAFVEWTDAGTCVRGKVCGGVKDNLSRWSWRLEHGFVAALALAAGDRRGAP